MQESFSFPAGREVFSLDIPFYRTPRGNGEKRIGRTYGAWRQSSTRPGGTKVKSDPSERQEPGHGRWLVTVS
jgi:hypothetical protein